MQSPSRSGSARCRVRPAKAQPCETLRHVHGLAQRGAIGLRHVRAERQPAQSLAGGDQRLAVGVCDERVWVALGRADVRAVVENEPRVGLVGEQVETEGPAD